MGTMLASQQCRSICPYIEPKLIEKWKPGRERTREEKRGGRERGREMEGEATGRLAVAAKGPQRLLDDRNPPPPSFHYFEIESIFAASPSSFLALLFSSLFLSFLLPPFSPTFRIEHLNNTIRPLVWFDTPPNHPKTSGSANHGLDNYPP